MHLIDKQWNNNLANEAFETIKLLNNQNSHAYRTLHKCYNQTSLNYETMRNLNDQANTETPKIILKNWTKQIEIRYSRRWPTTRRHLFNHVHIRNTAGMQKRVTIFKARDNDICKASPMYMFDDTQACNRVDLKEQTSWDPTSKSF